MVVFDRHFAFAEPMAFLVVSLSSFILSLILLLSFQHDGGIGVSALVVTNHRTDRFSDA